jgi:hypothetical protein
MSVHRLELSEEERQMVLLAMAVLSLESPGFDPMLNDMALRIDTPERGGRATMFDKFRRARADTITPEGWPTRARKGPFR